ncbi:MAG: dienelactone hydrolase family protein [Bacteroidetes bacterium]|nr:dienelactone hydrolase family protein [Bacteroidota bacterium]
MKKYGLLLISVLFFTFLFAQQKMSCCAASATESFSQLASDKNFILSHPVPLPFTFQSENGETITFKTTDGSEGYGWEIKSPTPTNNYLFVVHEWWGLNDYIKQESEKLWKDIGHVNVIAIDLYDKKVAATREDAAKYMQAVASDRAQAIIKGAIAYAGPNAKIYTIGWCFGGGWSLQTSLLAGKQAAGCVMYYGMPEKDLNKLKALHADVLGIFGNKDQWINPKVVDDFVNDMSKAGKKLIVKRYDADHAFANPSNPSFDKDAKEDAYKNTLVFLKERIK